MSLSVKILEKQSGTLSRTAIASLGGLITSETTGYTGVNCDIALTTTGNHFWELTGTSSIAMSMDYATSVSCVTGHKIYFTAEMGTISAGVEYLELYVQGTSGAGLILADQQANPVQNTWYTLSGIVDLTADTTGNIKLRFWGYDTPDITGTVVRVRNWTAIDLTAQFGAGDEPLAADLDTFYAWRWQYFTNKIDGLFTGMDYGDRYYLALKIASHGLEYNDIVKNDEGSYSWFSPVFVLNDNWIILQTKTDVSSWWSIYTDVDTFYRWTKTDYTSRVLARSLQINMRDDVDASVSLAFRADSTWQPLLGMTVIVYDGTETLFTGHITDLTKSKINSTNWRCDCVVSSLINTLKGQVYPYDDDWLTIVGATDTKSMIEYLFFDYVSGSPGDNTCGQCIWLGNLEDGRSANIAKDTQQRSIYELISGLCAAAGMVISMTGDRRIKFQLPLVTPENAPRNLTDAVSPNLQDLVYSENYDNYGSNISLRGSNDSAGKKVFGGASVLTPPITDDTFAAESGKTLFASDGLITNSTSATFAASYLLYQYGLIIPGELTFVTTDTDYRPGQKVQIEISSLGLSARYGNVDEVVIFDADGENLESRVKVSIRDETYFSVAPNRGSGGYLADISNRVSASVSALNQDAGTFTPAFEGSTDAGTWAWTTQTGYYVRHGSMVFVSIRLVPSSITDSPTGNLRLTGLPFAAAAAPANQFLQMFATGLNWGTSMTMIQTALDYSNTTGTVYGSLNNGAWGAVPVGNIVATDDVRIQGWYQITP